MGIGVGRIKWSRKGWRRRVQGETAGIEEDAWGGIETYYNENFLQPMRVILVRTLNNGGYGVSAGHP